MKLTESQLRKIVRDEILKEYGFIEALYMAPQGIIPTLIQMAQEMFAPSTGERLRDAGDDQVISDYQTFLGTLHMTPEYKAVWENYKQAQRRHASMDSDYDNARDIQSPVGRAFNRLKSMIFRKLDELEETLSPETRDIWGVDVEEQRQAFKKIFGDWERGKITTGRVLSMLDPKGIVEGRSRSPNRISEAGEMFWGKDLEGMKRSELGAAVEDAIMDLEDSGCPVRSKAMAKAEWTHDYLTKFDPRLEQEMSEEIEVEVQALADEIRSCENIEPRRAAEIADKVEVALDRYQEVDRY